MKLNLIYGEGDYLNGYLNLHPFAMQETEQPKIRIADIKNLDRWVSNAEATEIIATDVIDYLLIQEVPQIIAHWISKLRHGGKIVIGGTDMLEVSKAFHEYEIDLQTVNKLLHGQQTQPHLVKRVNLTLMGIKTFLQTDNHGLKIIKTRRAGYNYIVEAQRQ